MKTAKPLTPKKVTVITLIALACVIPLLMLPTVVFDNILPRIPLFFEDGYLLRFENGRDGFCAYYILKNPAADDDGKLYAQVKKFVEEKDVISKFRSEVVLTDFKHYDTAQTFSGENAAVMLRFLAPSDELRYGQIAENSFADTEPPYLPDPTWRSVDILPDHTVMTVILEPDDETFEDCEYYFY